MAEFTNFITLAAFIGVNAAAIMIFRHRGSVNQFRHILLNIIIPVLGVLVSLWLAVNAGWRAAVFGVIVAAVGWLVYRVNNKFKGRGRA